MQTDEKLYKMSKDELLQASIKDSLGMDNNKKYCIKDLEYIIKNTNILLKIILKTQKLTSEFCKTYLLDDKYVIFDGDDITIPEILKYQPHIKRHNLID